MYVGKRGQSIRQLGKPTYSVDSISLGDLFLFSNIPWIEHQLDLHIGLVEVLQKRPDANAPCNVSLSDEDSHWRNTIMKNVGCVPAFWKIFASSELFHDIPPDCSQEQYLKIDIVMMIGLVMDGVIQLIILKNVNMMVVTVVLEIV